jgi:hypothetical protein
VFEEMRKDSKGEGNKAWKHEEGGEEGKERTVE